MRTVAPGWWSHQIESPYYFLIIGVILFFLGLVRTCTGKASTRCRWVYRSQKPTEFWWVVAMYYLGAVLFIGIFPNWPILLHQANRALK